MALTITGGNKMLEQKDLELIAEIMAKTIEPLKSDVKKVQLTLENETNKKIGFIADGHLDLKVRRLKNRIKEIA